MNIHEDEFRLDRVYGGKEALRGGVYANYVVAVTLEKGAYVQGDDALVLADSYLSERAAFGILCHGR
jgi:hypothetical protein